MMASVPPHDRGDFEIAVICALALEAECVHDVLDKIWDDKKYGKAPGDDNAYTLGVIGEHNVVLVHLPGMGTDRAAFATASLKSSFPNIRLAVVAGICGGMPYDAENEEIVLGDVVISEALIRYDFGRQYPRGFQRKTDAHDILGPPNNKTLTLLAKLKTRQHRQAIQDDTAKFLQSIQLQSPKTVHPGSKNDILYLSSYTHQHRLPGACISCEQGTELCKDAVQKDCEDLECDPDMRISRQCLTDTSTTQPRIHFGIMGSGNTVMKSGYHRDTLAQQEGVIAVEMEGAGAWRYGPTIVIKGVCDYADSHKRKGWQQYAAATAAACAKAVLMKWTSEKRQIVSADTARVNEHFLVPTQRVKRLFGRENELNQIASYFNDDTDGLDTDQPRMLVLQAIGGQGKTQIALKYCYDSRQTYRGIFWVNGSTTFAMTRSLVGIAHELDKPASEMLPDDNARVDFALRALGKWEDRWLLVFDNCDDPATFSELQDKFLPQVGRGDILLTSRHRGLEELAHLIEIPLMPKKAGVELLLHRYRGIKIDDYVSEGSKIVNRLGGLALAIDQASAYMQYTHLPVNKLDTFLAKYVDQREKVLQHTTQDFWKYTKMSASDERETAVSAFTTWEMSFQQMLKTQPEHDHMAHFLTLSAFLGETVIDEFLFRYHWEKSKSPLDWMAMFTLQPPREAIPEVTMNKLVQPITPQDEGLSRLTQALERADMDEPERNWNTDRFWHVLYLAFQMSLLRSIFRATQSEEASFTLHPLVRDWLQLRLDLKERQSYTREATGVIASSVKTLEVEQSSAEVKSTIISHMNAALACDREFSPDGDRLGQTLSTCHDASWFAWFYRAQGQYEISRDLYSVMMGTRTTVLGTEHPDTLTAIHNLAVVLGEQGKYSEAEQMCRTVVEAKGRLLGKEHPNTLTAIDNLALVLDEQGKYSEAEQMYRTVVEAKGRLLGKEHPDTLTAMNNLARVLDEQGKYSKAEQMHREVLEMRKKVLGREHPDTIISMHNLAAALKYQGQNTEAENIQLRAVKAAVATLGRQHPKTELYINNLIEVWEALGREKAEIQKALDDVLEGANSSQTSMRVGDTRPR